MKKNNFRLIPLAEVVHEELIRANGAEDQPSNENRPYWAVPISEIVARRLGIECRYESLLGRFNS